MTELDEIKHIIFDTIGFQGDFEIETYSHDCIEATYENNKLCVGCSSKNGAVPHHQPGGNAYPERRREVLH